mgnify:CR=1 FL=1
MKKSLAAAVLVILFASVFSQRNSDRLQPEEISSISNRELSDATAFYVSLKGDDSGSGDIDEPFRTLERAVLAVRKCRKSPGSGPVRIILREGRHQLDSTLVLGPDDGTPGTLKAGILSDPGAGSYGKKPYLIFQAYPGEKPVISAGMPVSGWELVQDLPDGFPPESEGKIWVAKIPIGIERFNTLYDPSGRLKRAQSNGFNPSREGTQKTLYFPAGVLRNWSNIDDVEILIRPLNPWTINMLPLASVDEEKGVAQTSVSATYEMSPLRAWGHDRFGVSVWVENVPEALDEPGEWIVNTKIGNIYLWPRIKKTDGSPQGILVPSMSEIIRVEGNIDYDGKTDIPARGIAFKGLTFTHGDRMGWTNDEDRLGWGLQHDWEMFDRPTALLRFRGAEECLVQECNFEQSGGTGVRFDLYARYNRIEDSQFSHLGEAGILLAGYGPGTKDVNRNNEIVNNHIHHFGEIIWHAGGIWAWQSGYNRIAHNHVHHCSYSAILVTCRIKPETLPDDQGGRTIRHKEISPDAIDAGKTYEGWLAREKYHHSRHNLVEFNQIHNAVQKLSDGNGIYVSGAGDANIVRYNYLHDNNAPTITEVIRCDDDQHNTLVYGNICEGSAGQSVLSSKGTNYFVNNFIVHSKDNFVRAIISFERYAVDNAIVRKNIVVGHEPGGNICKYTKIGADSYTVLKTIDIDNNLYYHIEDSNWAADYLEKMHEGGQEIISRFGNPMFVDYSGGDYRFQSGSPALDMGIEPLSTSLMGRKEEKKQTNPSDETIEIFLKEHSLRIHLPANGSNATMSLLTLSGRKVKAVSLPSGKHHEYSVKELPKGWYIAQVEMNGREARTQFYAH